MRTNVEVLNQFKAAFSKRQAFTARSLAVLLLEYVKFLKESVINASPERVFEFHLLSDAFERLLPPWENVTIVQKADISQIGSRAILEQKLFSFNSVALDR